MWSDSTRGIEPKPFSSLKTFCGDFNAALIRHAIIGTCASILGAHIADCGKIPSTVFYRAICRLEQNPHTKWIGWWWCKQGGDTHRCLKLTSDWTETGNLEHIQRWSFSWELIAHARTSSLSHRQIWGTPILLIVRPTYELPLLLLLLFINHGSVPWGKLDFRVWYHISSKLHSSKEELYFWGDLWVGLLFIWNLF